MRIPSERELPSDLKSSFQPNRPPRHFSDEHTIPRMQDMIHARFLQARIFDFHPENTPDSFEHKKEMYLTNFIADYPEAIQTWEAGGLLEPEYHNIARHSLMAGAYADILTDLLGIEGQRKHDIVTAALIHDWYKIREKGRMDEIIARLAQKDTVLKRDDYRELQAAINLAKEHDGQQLQAMAFPQHVIELAGANVPQKDTLPETIDEQIVWLVDGMLYDEEAMPVTERMRRGRENGRHGGEQRAKRNQMLDRAQGLNYGNRRYFRIQEHVGQLVQENLVTELASRGHTDLPSTPQELPIFLKTVLDDRIKQAA